MENLKALNSKEKKNVSKLISDQFGCDYEINHEIYMSSKNKLFLISKDISKVDLSSLRVNSLGLYFGEINRGSIRLSLDGSQIIGLIAKRNVFELDFEDSKKWMAGEDIEVDSEINDFVIVKHNKDFIGCGKIVNRKLLNYVPKERRV